MNTDKNAIQTFLSFTLREEVFAINVSKVINILEMKPITKVPKTPAFMRGVINLRGMVLPVIDLRIKFGLPRKEATVDTSIIVLNINKDGDSVMLGILVDAVKEVLELKMDEIAPSPSIGTRYDAGFIEGMWQVDENFIMLLDIDKVFSVDDVIDFKDQIEMSV
ncbi:MAG TPA: chemotaxis protein CheW, partial [Bacteroidales bacterium]|nr:chemotaxis protein CheW [Bacteroidales bacterium]